MFTAFQANAVFFKLDKQRVVHLAHWIFNHGIGQLFVNQPDPIRKENGDPGDELGLLLDH